MLPLLNGRLVQRLRLLFNLRRTYLDDPVVEPVTVINDRISQSPQIIKSGVQTGDGDTTLYTTKDGRVNSYVVFVRGSLQRASTDAQAIYEITGVVNGERVRLWHFQSRNLTADRYSSGDEIPPVLVDPNTTILASIDGNAPASDFLGSVMIYEEPY